MKEKHFLCSAPLSAILWLTYQYVADICVFGRQLESRMGQGCVRSYSTSSVLRCAESSWISQWLERDSSHPALLLVHLTTGFCIGKKGHWSRGSMVAEHCLLDYFGVETKYLKGTNLWHLKASVLWTVVLCTWLLHMFIFCFFNLCRSWVWKSELRRAIAILWVY